MPDAMSPDPEVDPEVDALATAMFEDEADEYMEWAERGLAALHAAGYRVVAGMKVPHLGPEASHRDDLSVGIDRESITPVLDGSAPERLAALIEDLRVIDIKRARLVSLIAALEDMLSAPAAPTEEERQHDH